MKKLLGCLAVTGLLAAGCTSPDYYGAADDARYSAPSWGAGTDTPGVTPEPRPAGQMDPLPPAGTSTDGTDFMRR